jgi:hypothetical protein
VAPKTYNREKTASSTDVFGETGYLHVEAETGFMSFTL